MVSSDFFIGSESSADIKLLGHRNAPALSPHHLLLGLLQRSGLDRILVRLLKIRFGLKRLFVAQAVRPTNRYWYAVIDVPTQWPILAERMLIDRIAMRVLSIQVRVLALNLPALVPNFVDLVFSSHFGPFLGVSPMLYKKSDRQSDFMAT